MVGRSIGTGVAAAGTGVGGPGAATQLASSDAVVAPSSPRMSRRLIAYPLASCRGGHLACQKIFLLAESQLSRRIRALAPWRPRASANSPRDTLSGREEALSNTQFALS